jgi:hypothetical protein
MPSGKPTSRLELGSDGGPQQPSLVQVEVDAPLRALVHYSMYYLSDTIGVPYHAAVSGTTPPSPWEIWHGGRE